MTITLVITKIIMIDHASGTVKSFRGRYTHALVVGNIHADFAREIGTKHWPVGCVTNVPSALIISSHPIVFIILNFERCGSTATGRRRLLEILL